MTENRYHFIATIGFDKILFATRTLSYQRLRHFRLNVIIQSLLHCVFFTTKWRMVQLATLTADQKKKACYFTHDTELGGHKIDN